MKALKSSLAKELLADPTAAEKLRHYLVTKTSAFSRSHGAAESEASQELIEISSKDGLRRVRPMVVPKAA